MERGEALRFVSPRLQRVVRRSASGRLKALLPGYALPAATLYAVYTSRRYLSPKVRTFVDFLAGGCASGDDDGGSATAVDHWTSGVPVPSRSTPSTSAAPARTRKY